MWRNFKKGKPNSGDNRPARENGGGNQEQGNNQSTQRNPQPETPSRNRTQQGSQPAVALSRPPPTTPGPSATQRPFQANNRPAGYNNGYAHPQSAVPGTLNDLRAREWTPPPGFADRAEREYEERRQRRATRAETSVDPVTPTRPPRTIIQPEAPRNRRRVNTPLNPRTGSHNVPSTGTTGQQTAQNEEGRRSSTTWSEDGISEPAPPYSATHGRVPSYHSTVGVVRPAVTQTARNVQAALLVDVREDLPPTFGRNSASNDPRIRNQQNVGRNVNELAPRGQNAQRPRQQDTATIASVVSRPSAPPGTIAETRTEQPTSGAVPPPTFRIHSPHLTDDERNQEQNYRTYRPPRIDPRLTRGWDADVYPTALSAEMNGFTLPNNQRYRSDNEQSATSGPDPFVDRTFDRPEPSAQRLAVPAPPPPRTHVRPAPPAPRPPRIHVTPAPAEPTEPPPPPPTTQSVPRVETRHENIHAAVPPAQDVVVTPVASSTATGANRSENVSRGETQVLERNPGNAAPENLTSQGRTAPVVSNPTPDSPVDDVDETLERQDQVRHNEAISSVTRLGMSPQRQGMLNVNYTPRAVSMIPSIVIEAGPVNEQPENEIGMAITTDNVESEDSITPVPRTPSKSALNHRGPRTRSPTSARRMRRRSVIKNGSPTRRNRDSRRRSVMSTTTPQKKQKITFGKRLGRFVKNWNPASHFNLDKKTEAPRPADVRQTLLFPVLFPPSSSLLQPRDTADTHPGTLFFTPTPSSANNTDASNTPATQNTAPTQAQVPRLLRNTRSVVNLYRRIRGTGNDTETPLPRRPLQISGPTLIVAGAHDEQARLVREAMLGGLAGYDLGPRASERYAGSVTGTVLGQGAVRVAPPPDPFSTVTPPNTMTMTERITSPIGAGTVAASLPVISEEVPELMQTNTVAPVPRIADTVTASEVVGAHSTYGERFVVANTMGRRTRGNSLMIYSDDEVSDNNDETDIDNHRHSRVVRDSVWNNVTGFERVEVAVAVAPRRTREYNEIRSDGSYFFRTQIWSENTGTWGDSSDTANANQNGPNIADNPQMNPSRNQPGGITVTTERVVEFEDAPNSFLNTANADTKNPASTNKKQSASENSGLSNTRANPPSTPQRRPPARNVGMSPDQRFIQEHRDPWGFEAEFQRRHGPTPTPVNPNLRLRTISDLPDLPKIPTDPNVAIGVIPATVSVRPATVAIRIPPPAPNRLFASINGRFHGSRAVAPTPATQLAPRTSNADIGGRERNPPSAVTRVEPPVVQAKAKHRFPFGFSGTQNKKDANHSEEDETDAIKKSPTSVLSSMMSLGKSESDKCARLRKPRPPRAGVAMSTRKHERSDIGMGRIDQAASNIHPGARFDAYSLGEAMSDTPAMRADSVAISPRTVQPWAPGQNNIPQRSEPKEISAPRPRQTTSEVNTSADKGDDAGKPRSLALTLRSQSIVKISGLYSENQSEGYQGPTELQIEGIKGPFIDPMTLTVIDAMDKRVIRPSPSCSPVEAPVEKKPRTFASVKGQNQLRPLRLASQYHGQTPATTLHRPLATPATPRPAAPVATGESKASPEEAEGKESEANSKQKPKHNHSVLDQSQPESYDTAHSQSFVIEEESTLARNYAAPTPPPRLYSAPTPPPMYLLYPHLRHMTSPNGTPRQYLRSPPESPTPIRQPHLVGQPFPSPRRLPTSRLHNSDNEEEEDDGASSE